MPVFIYTLDKYFRIVHALGRTKHNGSVKHGFDIKYSN